MPARTATRIIKTSCKSQASRIEHREIIGFAPGTLTFARGLLYEIQGGRFMFRRIFFLCLLILFLQFVSYAQTVDLQGDCGAVGDGVTDDGPALQCALDALAAAGGGQLQVPAGHYAILTPVQK